MKPTEETIVDTPESAEAQQSGSPRLNVLKTYKLYIGGKQSRPDGGYSRSIVSPSGVLVGEAASQSAGVRLGCAPVFCPRR